MIRAAGRITAAGMKAAADTIRGGGIDSAASSAAFVAMLAEGSEFLADNPFVAIGPESAMAHARATNRRPVAGEVVPIMMSAAVHRYQCPVERTYTFGKPSKDLERSLTTVSDAVEAAIAAIRPGMKSFEADAVVRNLYERAGLDRYFLNRLGYSFGLAYPPVWWENEIMQLRPGDNRVIEEGMVFHLVPALHIPGQGFLNRSMPIVVTTNGVCPELGVSGPTRRLSWRRGAMMPEMIDDMIGLAAAVLPPVDGTELVGPGQACPAGPERPVVPTAAEVADHDN